MKSKGGKIAGLLLAVILIMGLPVRASAASREGSHEHVGPDISTVIFAAAGVGAVGVVVLYFATKKAKKVNIPDPVQVPQQKKAEQKPVCRATLVETGAALGGKHYGVISHVVIGSAVNADVRLNEPMITRMHCQVNWKNGRLYLMDLKSTNGTFLHRAGKLQPNSPVELLNGDVFWLGDERFSFQVKMK